MTPHDHRRLLLKFLLSSPLLGLAGCSTPTATQEKETTQAINEFLLSSPDDALNVFDFESMCRQKLPPAHFGYLATGVNDDKTLQANRTAFDRFKLKMQRLSGVEKPDLSTTLFSRKWPTPIVICPVGSQRAFHDEGELATARAAKSRNHLQMLSTVTTTSVEEVSKERGAPIWYQLYALTDWEGTVSMIRRAEDSGCEAIVLTVDLAAGTSNRETLERMIKLDNRVCANCHTENRFARKPMVAPIEGAKYLYQFNGAFLDKLRRTTKLKLLVKGIETGSDASICLQHGVDGVIVSNHGGRASETGRGTLEALPEVVAAVQGKVPVLIDGGFRRGTDIFKALALGATAVAIGRPYIWGLSSFGQAGVERVLDMLTTELSMTMHQAGTGTIADIKPSYLTT